MYGMQEQDPNHTDEAHEDLIAALAKFLRPSLYVEIGVAQGRTYRKVMRYARETRGCDIDPRTPPYPGVVIQDSLRFIRSLEDGSVDLALIDAEHRADQAEKEFVVLEPKMSPNGVVLFHDVYPPNRDFLDAGRCGDVFEVSGWMASRPGVESLTLASEYGLMLVRRKHTAPLWMESGDVEASPSGGGA